MKFPEVIYLVLGGGADGGKARCAELMRCLESESRSCLLLFSGKSSFDSDVILSEAELMVDFFKSHHAHWSDFPIVLENRSYDTLGNAILSRILLEEYLGTSLPAVFLEIVTDALHFSRASWIFSHVFPEIDFLKCVRNTVAQLPQKEVTIVEKSSIDTYFQQTAHSIESLAESVHAFLHHENETLREYVKKSVLEYDIRHFELQDFAKLRDYLFHLPVYRDEFEPVTYSYPMHESLYTMVVTYALHARKASHQRSCGG